VRVKYLVANQAWVLVLGDVIVGLDGYPRFWPSKKELEVALRECGLRLEGLEVKPRKVVESELRKTEC
jgi:hypothetical protein